MKELTRHGLEWVNSSAFTYDGTGDDIGENTVMRGLGSWVRGDNLLHAAGAPFDAQQVEEIEDIRLSLKEKLAKSQEAQRGGTTSLPFFSSDSSEYFLSSIIERNDKMNRFYLNTFLLCHFMLTPKPFGHKVHAERVSSATAHVITIISYHIVSYHLLYLFHICCAVLCCAD